jgi:hypothetical protein
MKHGVSNSPDSEFPYWVLPDKAHFNTTYGTSWDTDKTNQNEENFRNTLGQSCKGKWMETNHRYFFELEEDYQMFLVMCSLIN